MEKTDYKTLVHLKKTDYEALLDIVLQDWERRPLIHWMGLSDSLWGHITENRIRIRRIERLLGLALLSEDERQDIADELKKEAQAQWYETEKKEKALTLKKPSKDWINWRLGVSPLVFLHRIWVWLSPIRWSRQIWNILFRNPQSTTEQTSTNEEAEIKEITGEEANRTDSGHIR